MSINQEKQRVIIIGGGIIGTCCAFYLSQHDNFEITLIEKVDIACAASGKAGGFLARDWNDDHPGMKALTRASYELHEQLAQKLNGSQVYGYRTMNTYSVIFDSSLDKAGATTVEWVRQKTIRSFDQIGYTSSTAQVTPELFTRTLLKEAQKTGRVDVKIGQGVKELIFNDNTVVGVKLEDNEEIMGNNVIVSMGPWSGLLPMKNNETLPIRGSHVHSIILKPDESANILNQALFTAILDNGKTYEPEVYPRPDGTVYMCGAGDNEPLPPSADLVKANKKAIQLLTYQASLISSELTDRPIVQEQACYLPISKITQLPLIGYHPKYKNLVLATGHSFWGILNAPITGKIISELLIRGEVSSIDNRAMAYFKPK